MRIWRKLVLQTRAPVSLSVRCLSSATVSYSKRKSHLGVNNRPSSSGSILSARSILSHPLAISSTGIWYTSHVIIPTSASFFTVDKQRPWMSNELGKQYWFNRHGGRRHNWYDLVSYSWLVLLALHLAHCFSYGCSLVVRQHCGVCVCQGVADVQGDGVAHTIRPLLVDGLLSDTSPISVEIEWKWWGPVKLQSC